MEGLGDGAGVEIVGAENRAGQDVAVKRVTWAPCFLLLEATSSVSGSIIRVMVAAVVAVLQTSQTSLAQAFVHRCQRQWPGSGISSLCCARVASQLCRATHLVGLPTCFRRRFAHVCHIWPALTGIVHQVVLERFLPTLNPVQGRACELRGGKPRHSS